MKKTSRKSANDWLADILAERVLPGSTDSVPEGWLSLKMMCKEMGLSEAAMRVRVNRLVETGKLQRRQFKVFTGHQIMPTWFYHPAP